MLKRLSTEVFGTSWFVFGWLVFGGAATATLKVLLIALGIAGAAQAQETSGDPAGTGGAVEAGATTAAALDRAEAAGAVIEHADALNWTGNWRSFWRGGQALLTLKQDGNTVSGGYQPGDGKVTGTIDGLMVTGKWAQSGNEGDYEFAMAPDGRTFVGRSGNGEYWNGERLDGALLSDYGFGAATPKAALISLVAAANAAAEGDSVAEQSIRKYVTFEDGEKVLRAQNARVAQLLQLIDLSTFRALDAPESGEGGRATFVIGPAGADWTFPLEFGLTGRSTWAVVVPPRDTLVRWYKSALEALVMPSGEALAEARRYNPRQTMHDFMAGAATWSEGGDSQVMATLDLSEIPESLRAVDGPLAAEYIRQIIDRIGYTILQEIPDDPNRRRPYVVYEHALGNVAIDRYPQADGTVRWLFSAETLAAAPGIYDAMQNLPVAAGVEQGEPLARSFKLRSELKQISPRLLKRPFLLENWQWLGIAAALLTAFVLSWIVARLARLVVSGMLRLGGAGPETRSALGFAFGWPCRLFAAGAILTLLLHEIGLRQDVSAICNGFATLMMLLGGTFFLYSLVNAATVWLMHSAANTETAIDDIAVSLGGGLAKIAVIVGGVMLGAEVLGMPYEGVIAGLGVGGLALAIASRDAVSNFIGAGILMSDKPFKKGDLIEGAGLKGIVEDVGLRSTRLRTPDNAVVIVPNSKLSDGNVNNWGRPSPITSQPIDLDIGVAYGTPREKLDAFVERLREVFRAQPAAEPNPRAALAEIGPSSLGIKLTGSFNTERGDLVAAKHKLLGDIVALAHEMGIGFAYPTSTMHFVGEPVRGPMPQSAMAQSAA